MPDPARIAQAQALEVPLVLQGAKTDDGMGRRELFTENATTTLVFDNGAVLNLRSRLAVGQPVLIHNEQNGREILCKVLEAPPAGEPGYTDLEFTTADPEFWLVNTQQPDPSAQNGLAADEKHETNNLPEAPAEDTLAMMSETASKIELPALTAPGTESGMPLREELVPAHEMVPEISAVALVPALSTEHTEPTGEQIDAALRQMSSAARLSSPEVPGASLYPDSGAGSDQTQDEKHLAALMARDARFAKFAAIREKQVEKIQRDAAQKSVQDVAPEAESVPEQRIVLSITERMRRFASGKKAIIVQIAAGVAIAISLGFLWHTVHGVFFPKSSRPSAAAALGNPGASPALAPPAQGLVSAVATAPPAAAPASSIPPRPVLVPAPDVPAGKLAAAKTTEVNSGGIAIAQSKHRNPPDANSLGNVSVRILSQPQPTLPPWAKGLEVGGVVTLDAVIDEKGNVAQTKVLSGPRVLQHAAEQAVGLWLFKPAQSAGRPISTHIILTVDFQQ